MSGAGGRLDDEARKQEAVEASHTERDARLRLLTAQIPAIVWSTDLDLRFTSGTGAALGALGLRPDALQGVSLWDYFQTRDPAEPQIAAHLAALRGESVGFRANWASRVFEAFVEPLRDAAGAIIGTLGIALDVTERERAEGERTLLQAKLRHQQRLEAVGTLASGVAHEINNPVQSIMNYAQLIRRRAGSPEVETYAAEILHEAQRVAAIVNNLRSFTRQEGEPYTAVGLAEIVENTLALIEVMLRREGIELRVDVPASAPVVRCHPQQIQQLLMNLITNARDALDERYPAPVHPSQAAPAGRKVISIASSLVRDDMARLTVEDCGTGIAPELLDKIFDPFYTTKSERPGAGLGLSLSLAIAREHGGALTVESELGSYTRVHLDLPCVTAAD
jgi:PAS domain S-box-containing protein